MKKRPTAKAGKREEVEGYLQGVAEQALIMLRKKRVHVRVFCAANKDMKLMANRYLHKDKPIVDVLAFPELKDFPQPDAKQGRLLGEVYVNFDAFKRDLSHMRFLTIHGVLHLLGYQHEGKRDTMVMQKLEEHLCQRIALPG